jgi:hypothetical protein
MAHVPRNPNSTQAGFYRENRIVVRLTAYRLWHHLPAVTGMAVATTNGRLGSKSQAHCTDLKRFQPYLRQLSALQNPSGLRQGNVHFVNLRSRTAPRECKIAAQHATSSAQVGSYEIRQRTSPWASVPSLNQPPNACAKARASPLAWKPTRKVMPGPLDE